MLICKARMEEEEARDSHDHQLYIQRRLRRRGNYPKTCPVTHQDMFQVKNKSGIDGDYGKYDVWNDAGFLTGLHFDGLDAAGNLGTNCKATYLTPELGVH